MAIRSALARIPRLYPSSPMEGSGGAASAALRSSRYFSDDKGRIFSEEEKAAENVYIKKMEKERLEKMKKKAEAEKAEVEKGNADKKPE